jgi:hypothetical protein
MYIILFKVQAYLKFSKVSTRYQIFPDWTGILAYLNVHIGLFGIESNKLIQSKFLYHINERISAPSFRKQNLH